MIQFILDYLGISIQTNSFLYNFVVISALILFICAGNVFLNWLRLPVEYFVTRFNKR